MQRRWLLLAVILTVTSGCDNVTWGGTEVRLQGPPELSSEPAAPAEEPEAGAAPEDPFAGPILLAGTREGDTVRLAVVGHVQEVGLGPFPTAAEAPGLIERLGAGRLRPGTELVLFSEGVRVGRMTVREVGVDDRFCTPRPVVVGVPELVPGAAQATRFLALADSAAEDRAYGEYRALDDQYDQRVASLALASEAIQQVGAPWPTSLLESRADIRAFRLGSGAQPSFAATFLLRDRLSISTPAADAYALLVIGSEGAGGYRAAYTWFRRAQEEGKGAPRYFDHLDFDGDGTSEVLLEVFGERHRWFASLSTRNGTWVRSFQDPCGTPSG